MDPTSNNQESYTVRPVRVHKASDGNKKASYSPPSPSTKKGTHPLLQRVRLCKHFAQRRCQLAQDCGFLHLDITFEEGQEIEAEARKRITRQRLHNEKIQYYLIGLYEVHPVDCRPDYTEFDRVLDILECDPMGDDETNELKNELIEAAEAKWALKVGHLQQKKALSRQEFFNQAAPSNPMFPVPRMLMPQLDSGNFLSSHLHLPGPMPSIPMMGMRYENDMASMGSMPMGSFPMLMPDFSSDMFASMPSLPNPFGPMAGEALEPMARMDSGMLRVESIVN